jgi:esterase/lipase
MAELRYLIDSNIFIEAHRRYYAFNLCPGFWKSLLWLHGQGHILSLDKVKDELTEETDDLEDWAKNTMPKSGFAPSDDSMVVELYGKIQIWAQNNSQFIDAAKEEFAQVADPWLIAFARAHEMVLVTHEQYVPQVKKRIPIPNVCREFGVRHANTFEMLTAFQVQYHWSEPSDCSSSG